MTFSLPHNLQHKAVIIASTSTTATETPIIIPLFIKLEVVEDVVEVSTAVAPAMKITSVEVLVNAKSKSARNQTD